MGCFIKLAKWKKRPVRVNSPIENVINWYYILDTYIYIYKYIFVFSLIITVLLCSIQRCGIAPVSSFSDLTNYKCLHFFACPMLVYTGALDQDCRTALAGWTGTTFISVCRLSYEKHTFTVADTYPKNHREQRLWLMARCKVQNPRVSLMPLCVCIFQCVRVCVWECLCLCTHKHFAWFLINWKGFSFCSKASEGVRKQRQFTTNGFKIA